VSFRRIYSGFFLASITLILIAVTYLGRTVAEEAKTQVRDHVVEKLRSELAREKEQAFSFAVALAQNKTLRIALAEEDDEEGYRIISQYMQTLKRFTSTNYRTQVITPDLTIFARSWDNVYAGFPLRGFRPDLQDLESVKPRVSIEIGRLLGFKATVPIVEKGTLLGFVEVLEFFNRITDEFRHFGADLLVLMDDEYYDTAVLMQDNPRMGDYILANPKTHSYHLKVLKDADLERIVQERLVRIGDYYYVHEPLRDGKGERIGMYLIALNQNLYDHLKENDISFFLNFSTEEMQRIVKKREYPEGFFKNRYDRELLYLKDVVPMDEREMFMHEARERFDEYTKDELIELILQHRFNRRIQGEIR